MLVSIKIMHQN